MNIRKTVFLITVTGAVLLAALIWLIRQGRDSQMVMVIKGEDLDAYETNFQVNLQDDVRDADNGLAVKDVTGSSLNNAYRGDQLIKRQCFSGLGLLSIQKETDLDFGAGCRIPAVYMKGGGSLLLSDEKERPFLVEEECVRVALSFRVNTKDGMETEEIRGGVRQDGNYLTISFREEEGYYKGEIWLFKGSAFYPWIENAGTQEIILTDAEVTIVRDDTVTQGE